MAADEKPPRMYAAQIFALPEDERDAWAAEHVPPRLLGAVRSHIENTLLAITRYTLYVAKGETRDIRAERLARVPEEIRVHVQVAVTERFAARRQARGE